MPLMLLSNPSLDLAVLGNPDDINTTTKQYQASAEMDQALKEEYSEKPKKKKLTPEEKAERKRLAAEERERKKAEDAEKRKQRAEERKRKEAEAAEKRRQAALKGAATRKQRAEERERKKAEAAEKRRQARAAKAHRPMTIDEVTRAYISGAAMDNELKKEFEKGKKKKGRKKKVKTKKLARTKRTAYKGKSGKTRGYKRVKATSLKTKARKRKAYKARTTRKTSRKGTKPMARKIKRSFKLRKRGILIRLLKRLVKKRFKLALGRRKRPGTYRFVGASSIRKRRGYRLRSAKGIPWSGRYGNYLLGTVIRYRTGKNKYRKKYVVITNPTYRRNPPRRRRWTYTPRKARSMLRKLRRNPVIQEIKNIPNAVSQTFKGPGLVKNLAVATAAAIGAAYIGSKLYEARKDMASDSKFKEFLDKNSWTGAIIPALIGVIAGAFVKDQQLKGAIVTGAIAATGLNLAKPTWLEDLNKKVFKGTSGYDLLPAYAGTGSYDVVPAYAGTGSYDVVPAYAGTGSYDVVPAYAGTGADDIFAADDLAADDLAADDLAADDLADDTVLAGLGSYLADSVSNAGSYLN